MSAKHPNLVLEWRLDGNAADTSGNGLDGTPQQMSYEAGLGSRIGVFDDTSPGSQVSRASVTPTANMTVCCWARRSAISEGGYVFAFGNPASERRVNVAVIANDARWALVDAGPIRYGNAVGDMTTLAHVALLVVGRDATLYVDGVSYGTITYGGDPLVTAAQFTVGGRTGSYSSGAWLNGRVARVRVYNVALDLGDIRRDMLGLLPIRRYT